MVSEEQPKTQFLQVSYLSSIKTKIIVFALLATVIPSVSMGWFSYVQNRRFLSDKIEQELKVVTSQTARELNLWLKDRLYDLRVFSSSYMVLENLENILRAGNVHIENVVAQLRLRDYLKSVQKKIVDYQELIQQKMDAKKAAAMAVSTSQMNVHQEGMYHEICELLGEPVNAATGAGKEDDDDDIIMMNTTGSAAQWLKCPITGLLMEDPIRSTVCHHVYSR